MKKLIALIAVVCIAELSFADMVTIYTNNSWDLPVKEFSIEAILEKNRLKYADYVQVDMSTWFISGAEFSILGEVAGNKDGNVFGWYNISGSGCKPSDLYTIFQGTSSQGDSKSVVFPSTRNTAIGFYLDPADNGLNSTDKFYSESALNNGNGQVAVFQNKSNADDYILAWEDLSLKNGCSAQNPMVYTSTAWTDGDYNDFIVQVKVVPEPVITSLFIVSILILICITFTQKKTQHVVYLLSGKKLIFLIAAQ